MVDLTLAVAGTATVAVLVGISAFFSSSESAIFSLPPGGAREGEAPEDRRATTLADLREDPHRLLVTILVGNNVVNVAISSITTVVVLTYLPAGQAVTIATVVASCLVLVFGEIVPKAYGLGNAERWSLAVATPLKVTGLVLYPLVVAFDAVTSAIGGFLGGEPKIEDQYLGD